MTVTMQREKILPFILPAILLILGLAGWLFGMRAVTHNTIQIDYALTLRGLGGAIALLGFVWLMLESIRLLSALPNLGTAMILAILTLAGLLVTQRLITKNLYPDFTPSLLEGSRYSLIVGVIWLILSVGKLILTTPSVSGRHMASRYTPVSASAPNVPVDTIPTIPVAGTGKARRNADRRHAKR